MIQELAKLQRELRIWGANIVQITPQEGASLVSLPERWVSLYRANIVQITTYSLVSLQEMDHFSVSQVGDDGQDKDMNEADFITLTMPEL